MVQTKCRRGIDGGKERALCAERIRRHYSPSLDASLNENTSKYIHTAGQAGRAIVKCAYTRAMLGDFHCVSVRGGNNRIWQCDRASQREAYS